MGLSLGLLLGCGGSASSDAGAGAAVLLSDDASGATKTLSVQQGVDITLHTIGPGNYDTPQLSSNAVKFVGMSYPGTQNPGGPTQLFQFEAVSAGASTITIPHTQRSEPFTITLDVR